MTKEEMTKKMQANFDAYLKLEIDKEELNKKDKEVWDTAMKQIDIDTMQADLRQEMIFRDEFDN